MGSHCLGRDIKENEMICCKDYDFIHIYILDNWFMQKNKFFDDVFWRNDDLKFFPLKLCSTEMLESVNEVCEGVAGVKNQTKESCRP